MPIQPPMHVLPQRLRSATRRLPLALGLAALSGCAANEESFPTRSADQVWTAMVAAAERPVYDDWHVIENDVWVDDAGRRIEIYRRLRAYRDPPGQYSRLEDREWTFVASFEDRQPPDAPTVRFDIRGWHIPSHGWKERDRYFRHVRELLAAEPSAVPVQMPDQTQAADQPGVSEDLDSPPS
jgi:hypothetical protein